MEPEPGILILVMLLLRPAEELPPMLPLNMNRQTEDVVGRLILPEYINFLMPGKVLEILVQVVLPACAGHTGETSMPLVGG